MAYGIFNPVSEPCDPDPSSPARRDALQVLRHLRAAGHVAYFAGGCVRDQLLGLMPKDYDIATDALPQQVQKLFPNSQNVGAAFGVILVRKHSSTVEVATFRTDADYADGRRPNHVRFTTAQEDAQRRDFTINGLFFDPIENRVIDYVDGQTDLAERRLRAIGDPFQRFGEDYLRLLRAVRFAARFDLSIDGATGLAMSARADALIRISPERIAGELRAMLTPRTRARAWALLRQHRLIGPVTRFLRPADEPMPDSGFALFDRIAPEQVIDFPLALAGLCVESSLPLDQHGSDVRGLVGPARAGHYVKAMRQALRISNEESDHLRQIITHAGQLLDDPTPGIAQLKRFLAAPTSASTRHLLKALAKACPNEEWIQLRTKELALQFSKLLQSDYHPAPLLNGDDLTAEGWRPGPIFKQVLDAVYDAQLEGKVLTHDQAMTMASRLRPS